MNDDVATIIIGVQDRAAAKGCSVVLVLKSDSHCKPKVEFHADLGIIV